MVDRHTKKVLWFIIAMGMMWGTVFTGLKIADKRQEIKIEKMRVEEERSTERMEQRIRDRKLELLEQIIKSYENNDKDTAGRSDGRR